MSLILQGAAYNKSNGSGNRLKVTKKSSGYLREGAQPFPQPCQLKGSHDKAPWETNMAHCGISSKGAAFVRIFDRLFWHPGGISCSPQIQ